MAIALHKTALLLFVRDEREEAQLKPLVSHQRADTVLYRRFNTHARQQARRTGLPLFVVKGKQQRGDSFGERLAHAIESVFAQGFQRVITLGNDCLKLHPHHILLAAKQMQQHDLVLGPSADGGVYLLGISKSAFERQDFVSLPWQTKFLCGALQCYASHSLLPDLVEDMDDWQGFQRELGRITGSLGKRLQAIVALHSPPNVPEPYVQVVHFQSGVGLRAPPQ